MAKRKSYNTRALVNVARTSYEHVLTVLRRNDIEPQDILRVGKRVYRRWGQDAMDCVEAWRYERDAEKLEQILAKERETESQPETVTETTQHARTTKAKAQPAPAQTAGSTHQDSLQQELFRALQKMDTLIASVAYLRGEVATLAAQVRQHPVQPPLVPVTVPQYGYPYVTWTTKNTAGSGNA